MAFPTGDHFSLRIQYEHFIWLPCGNLMVVETKFGIPQGLKDDNNENFQMLSSQNKCREE